MYQPFPFQGPPKFSQIGIFGLKIYHLATLNSGTEMDNKICVCETEKNSVTKAKNIHQQTKNIICT
jgi:hypothetical protein